MWVAIPCFAQGVGATGQMSDDARTPGTFAQNGAPVIQTRDGGAAARLESIAVPPKPGAPFTLTLETEWVKPMSDGGTQTLVTAA